MQQVPTLVPEKLYTSEEVSEFLRLSLRTVQRLLQQNNLPAYRIHGQYRIKGLDLLAYLDGVRQDPQGSDHLQRPADLVELLEVHPISIEFGANWLAIIAPDQAQAFLARFESFRKQHVKELGFILPGLQLKDDLDLGDNGYCIYLQGTALIRQGLDPSLLYTRTDQPSEDSFALALLPHTYFKVDPDGDLTATDLLLLQLSAVVRAYAYEILSRDEVGVILERLHSRCEVVIQEVIAPEPAPGRLTIGQLTTILRYLLQEQVSIRNLPRILEILANHLPSENNLAQLAEKVRQGLARQLTAAQLNADGVLEVLTIQPEDEAAMRQDLLATGPTQAKTDWANRLTSALEAHTLPKLLLCAPDIRRALFELVSRRFPQLQVISYQEVAST